VPRFAWFAAAAAWAAQLFVGFMTSAGACCTGGGAPPLLTARSARAIDLVVSAAALVVAVGCAVIGARARRTGHAAPSDATDAFFASVSTLAGVVFTVAILGAGFALFMLPVCERMR
jgi:hypothetical protein